jgi:hypothetical protein
VGYAKSPPRDIKMLSTASGAPAEAAPETPALLA